MKKRQFKKLLKKTTKVVIPDNDFTRKMLNGLDLRPKIPAFPEEIYMLMEADGFRSQLPKDLDDFTFIKVWLA